MTEAYLTEKQLKIMDLVFRGNADGSFLDIDQLIEKMGATSVSKQAMQCSLNWLEKHDLIGRGRVKRRGASRRIVKPTPKAFLVLRRKGAASVKLPASL